MRRASRLDWAGFAFIAILRVVFLFQSAGIKRDRLPWAGDLATSIASHAYSFGDEESIRWTLTVLGRCGLDDILDAMRVDWDVLDHGDMPESVLAASKLDAHVNGMIDYSLWFIVSHWSYQRHFDDRPFLRREWNVIESRLRYLLRHCTDAKAGWLVVDDDDCVFIDWISDSNAEKSKTLQIRELVRRASDVVACTSRSLTPSRHHGSSSSSSSFSRSLVVCA